MGSRHLSELLLRPSSLRTLSVAPIPNAAWQRTSACLSKRNFSHAIPKCAAQPQPRRDPTPETEEPQHNTSRADRQAQSQSQSEPQDDPIFYSTRQRSEKPTTTQALDDMFANFNRGTASRSAPRTTSADEFGAAFNKSRSTFGSDFSRLPARGKSSFKPKGLDFGAMTMPTPHSSSMPASQAPAVREEDKKYPRLNPSTGRAVELDPAKGRDIVRGLGMLASLMARNRVKSDMFKQRFHERPGLKRKRLKSERWRARFKIEFDRTCKRVSDLTRKGW